MVHGPELLVIFNLCHELYKLCFSYNGNSIIELKKTEDSFASAANLRSIGWKKDKPCFYKVDLKKNTQKYLYSSAKKINYKKKASFYKTYINNFDKLNKRKFKSSNHYTR